MRRTSAAVVLAPALLLLAFPAHGLPRTEQAPDDAVHAEARVPGLRVTRVASGLDHPWAVHRLGKRRLLVTQRDSARLTMVWPSTQTSDTTYMNVGFPSRRVWVSGETGLMGLEVDPSFSRNRRIYTCSGWRKVGGGHDIRVIAWRFNDAMTRVGNPHVLVRIPNSFGRHGGCQLLIARNGSLLVGTGDSAVGRYPQSLGALAGKVLRLDRLTGRPWSANPWAGASGVRRYILSYGHRNVQGLAQRRNGSLWSVEHGTYRDDEVNRLVAGGNYGYHPVPGYNESVPMTDFSLPGEQHRARWRSGTPTIATSGAAFVRGAGWGGYDGALAVAALAGSRMVFMKFTPDGRLRWTRTPVVLRRYGRLRGVAYGPGSSLLVTTSNGNGRDVVLKVRPRG